MAVVPRGVINGEKMTPLRNLGIKVDQRRAWDALNHHLRRIKTTAESDCSSKEDQMPPLFFAKDF